MLKRDIGRWDLVLLVINGIIGAGIFGLPSKIFALSGFYSLYALLVCAVVVLIVILVFSEVASRFTETGGPYLYTLAAFGRMPGYIIGWLMLISRLTAYAALINLFVIYLGYFHETFNDPFVRALTIILYTTFLSFVNFKGVKNSAILSNILAVTKVSTLLIFVIVGLFFINSDLLTGDNKVPDFTDFSASVLIFIFAFSGFEATMVNTGEVKNPRRNIPFALIISMLFVAGFFFLIQFVSIGTLPELATSEKPLTEAAQIFMGPLGGTIISIGALISIGGTLNAIILVGSRLPFAFSEEQQLPKIFSYLHPEYKTPVYSLIAFSLVSVTFSITGSFIYAVSVNVISKVLVYLAVSIILIKLRKMNPEETGHFKLPYGYFLSILGVLVSVWMISSSKLSEFRDVLITVVVGIAIYGSYKLYRSRRNK